MDFDENYKLAMDTILQLIDSETLPELSQAEKRVSNKLYKDISEGIKNAKILVTLDKLEILQNEKMKCPEKSLFICDDIVVCIKNNMIKQYVFNCNIHGKSVTISIGIMNTFLLTDEELVRSIQLMVSWLFVCYKYVRNENFKPLKIDVYFTDIKRGFPNNNNQTIDAVNINGGLTYIYDGSIVVFRYEEWFKVFIHECGHSLGFESHNFGGGALANFVNNMISLKVNNSIGEAYVEAWARIIAVFYSSISNSTNYKDFLILLRFNMKVESLFSVMQAYRVLAFMNMPYSSVIDPLSSKGKLYKETTNVFAYFILCGSFMRDPFKFLRFCDKYNTNLLQINEDNVTLDAFKKYIAQCLHNNEYKNQMYKYQHLANRRIGLRFTLTNISKL